MLRCFVIGWALLLMGFSCPLRAEMLIPAFGNWGLNGSNTPYAPGATVSYSLAMGGTRNNPTQDNTQKVNVYLSRVQNSTASPAVLLPPGVTADVPASMTFGPEVNGQAVIPTTFGGVNPIPAGTYYIVFSAVGATGSAIESSQLTIGEPDISVEEPVGTALTNGSSTASFTAVAVSGTSSDTFLIRNPGTEPLTGISATISGTNSGDFSVTTAAATSVAVGSSTSLVVQFSPHAAGNRMATLSITSNVAVKSPFVINLSGSGDAAPAATTGSVSNVTATTAVLGGTVNAEGTTTTPSFQYGPNSSYGMNAATSPSSVSGNSDTAVSASLSGLTPGTTYHYRVDAISVGGSVSGSDAQFTTSAAPVPAMPQWGYLVLIALLVILGAFGLRPARRVSTGS